MSVEFMEQTIVFYSEMWRFFNERLKKYSGMQRAP